MEVQQRKRWIDPKRSDEWVRIHDRVFKDYRKNWDYENLISNRPSAEFDIQMEE